jgi:hypothetical protein
MLEREPLADGPAVLAIGRPWSQHHFHVAGLLVAVLLQLEIARRDHDRRADTSRLRLVDFLVSRQQPDPVHGQRTDQRLPDGLGALRLRVLRLGQRYGAPNRL